MTYKCYIGIDYSGAKTPTCSLKGLRIYETDGTTPPEEVPPPPSPRKYWTRREVAEWLADTLAEGPPTLVGIDHAFSFPLRYFEVHWLQPEWSSLCPDRWPSPLTLDCPGCASFADRSVTACGSGPSMAGWSVLRGRRAHAVRLIWRDRARGA